MLTDAIANASLKEMETSQEDQITKIGDDMDTYNMILETSKMIRRNSNEIIRKADIKR